MIGKILTAILLMVLFAVLMSFVCIMIIQAILDYLKRDKDL